MGVWALKQRQQLGLDLRLAGLVVDLGAGQIGDVEHVDRLLAEGGDLRRGDVEVEAEQRFGDVVEQPVRSRPLTSITVKRFDDWLSTVTRGSTRKALRRGLVRRCATIVLRWSSPLSALRMSSPTRSARRCSSASSANSRLMIIVSSAMPSTVVKICAEAMLPPAAAQAPADRDSSRGWSGVKTVISVMP